MKVGPKNSSRWLEKNSWISSCQSLPEGTKTFFGLSKRHVLYIPEKPFKFSIRWCNPCIFSLSQVLEIKRNLRGILKGQNHSQRNGRPHWTTSKNGQIPLERLGFEPKSISKLPEMILKISSKILNKIIH